MSPIKQKEEIKNYRVIKIIFLICCLAYNLFIFAGIMYINIVLCIVLLKIEIAR